MTEAPPIARSQRHCHGRVAARLGVTLFFVTMLTACGSKARNDNAVFSFYRYDFPAAREAVRGNAMRSKTDDNTILNHTRLGLVALADGDLDEAELALGKSFELLSTAGLNKDRTIGAVLIDEGVRIWKGEPFEQALTYHEVATLYALKGDWENCRAAAANALFRLTDFGANQDPEKLTRRAAKDENYLERGYTAVDTNFALGFLMQAIGSDLSGTSGAEGQFEAAAQINPALQPTIDTLRSREYDTLLIVDYGRGPTKTAYGPDQALVRFQPRNQVTAPLVTWAGSEQLARTDAVCDVNSMSVDHRWNNLEDIRKAKSLIGNVLLYGGLGATAIGAHNDDSTVALAGLGAMAIGLLTKAGAKGDTRHCEFFPQSIFLVPLKLEQPRDVRVTIEGDTASMVMLDDVNQGTSTNPRTIYLRLLGRDAAVATPSWLSQRNADYGNDHTGVAEGDFPWILGGHDVSTPTRETLEAYQRGGHLTDFMLNDLLELYQSEGILIGSGMENAPDQPRNPSFRHILEGGTGLFTPEPNSVGYKRIMCGTHQPYQPQSNLARSLYQHQAEETTDEQ